MEIGGMALVCKLTLYPYRVILHFAASVIILLSSISITKL